MMPAIRLCLAVPLLLLLVLQVCARAQLSAALPSAIEGLIAEARARGSQPCQPEADRLVAVLCQGQLRVGVRADYPQFGVAGPNGSSGYEIDLAHRIAEQFGVSLQLVPVTPATRLSVLGEGKVDLVIATMGHTADRDGEARFIRPHYYASETVVLGPRGVVIADWRDFAGATVCATVGNNSNTTLVEHNVRLLLFDTPSRLLDQLEQGSCTFIAQDDVFFAASFVQPAFAAHYDVKLAFGTLPWGMAVAQNGTESFARVLSLLSAKYHRDGVFLALAEANHVGTGFLRQQQAVWRRADCDRAEATVAASCLLPPLDNRLKRLLFAGDVERLEEWMQSRLSLRVSLPMFKTVVALELFRSGLVYTLVLVFGAIACTAAVAFAFGAVLWSRNRIAATFVRWLVLFFRSSPIVLLLFVGFTAATVVTQYSLAVALIVAIITLGLFNGSYAAQAIADVRAELVREREGVPPRFRLLASRAATPLTGFLINASKGSAAASMIGAPELLSATTDISSFSSERLSLYSLLLVLYLALVLLVIGLCKVLRRVLLRLEHAA